MPDGPENDDLPSAQNSGDNTSDSLEPDAPEPEVIPPARKRGRIENLKPWPKGKSGNPGGRPKRGVLTDALALISDKRTPDEMLTKLPPSVVKLIGKRPTMAQVLMYRLFTSAMQGDIGAQRLIFERLEGRVPVEAPSTHDEGQLDKLMEVLSQGGVPPGEVNE